MLAKKWYGKEFDSDGSIVSKCAVMISLDIGQSYCSGVNLIIMLGIRFVSLFFSRPVLVRPHILFWSN